MTLLTVLSKRLTALGIIAILITTCSGRAIANDDAGEGNFERYSGETLPEYSVLNVRFPDVEDQCYSKRGIALIAGLSALYNEKKLNSQMGFFVVPCDSQNSGSEGYSTTAQTNKNYRVIFPTNSNGDVISPRRINVVNVFSNLKTYQPGSVGFVHLHLEGPQNPWGNYDGDVMCGLNVTVFLYRHNHVMERYSLPTLDRNQTQPTNACLDEVRTNKPVPTQLWKLNVDASKVNLYIDPGVPMEE